jgi:hypothetical protein
MSEPNIYQRINAVMKVVKYVQKDVSITGVASYKAVSHDMVLAVLRGAMVENGIVVRTEQLRGDIVQMRDIKQDIKMHLYSADYAVHFVNIDKPDDFMTVTINSHAADTGDKAPGKACSYAVKYALLKTFSLETGESDESRMFEPAQFTDIQKAEFDEFIDSNSNGLGFICFQATVGGDVMTALNSSFDKGKISSGKTTVRKLEREGWDTLKASAAAIGNFIQDQDSHGLLETVAELEPIERKLLAGLLSPDQIKAIKDVQELST